MDTSIERWKENNTEGYERAVNETSSAYLETLNASRYDKNQPVLTPEEKADIKATLVDPDQTQRLNAELAETLSEDAMGWRDARYTHASNMALASEVMNKAADDENTKNIIEGLQASSGAIRGKYPDIGTDEEIAESYGYSIDPKVMAVFKENDTALVGDNDKVVPTVLPSPNDTPSFN